MDAHYVATLGESRLVVHFANKVAIGFCETFKSGVPGFPSGIFGGEEDNIVVEVKCKLEVVFLDKGVQLLVEFLCFSDDFFGRDGANRRDIILEPREAFLDCFRDTIGIRLRFPQEFVGARRAAVAGPFLAVLYKLADIRDWTRTENGANSILADELVLCNAVELAAAVLDGLDDFLFYIRGLNLEYFVLCHSWLL